ncbi:HVO_2901 family zinc finger protein [Halobacteriaceae archaeon SHR40]|uniref:HVO_2901 family zinc finger protein n=1 Tax=Halovenus amylolytica TaxID=2500550 RepID=UPI000FE36D72
MVHTCRNCKRTFSSELELDLHQDNCTEGDLFCDRCGERFSERKATTDGWHYRCPTEDCDGEGIGEEIHKVTDVRLQTP